MTEKATFICDVRRGKLSDDDRRSIAAMIAKLDGMRIVITIAKYVRTMTHKQRRFMHGPFFQAMQKAHEQAGEILSLDEVKELFKRAFGVKTFVTGIDGKSYEILKSTAKYTTIECEQSMEMARAFYAQWGHMLPFPNEDMDD